MGVFFQIAYFLVGLFQLFATIDGIKLFTGLGTFASVVIALFLNFIPLIGSILGIYGAMNVWDWGFWQSALLFFWYIPVAIVFILASTVGSRAS
jgi:hypothetical protein